jgi:hypothetical protein
MLRISEVGFALTQTPDRIKPMFYSLALAALAAAPAQGGELKLANVRMTIGELGGPRPSAKLLPGDVLFIGYDINGLNIEPNGVAKYRMAMEVTDAAGKQIFKQDARDLEDFVPLRGNVIPARAFITVGLDQDPGTYTCRITVEDPKTKGKDSLTTKFEVGKRDFGIVAVYTTHDERGGISAPTTGVVGQTIFIQFSVASFQRDAKTKQPNVQFEFQILDEKGNPILGQPRTHTQDEKSPQQVDEKEGAFAMRFPLFMSRPGKFTVRITATDKVANKKAVYDLPVTILPAN